MLFHAKGVSEGIAIGKLYHYKREKPEVSPAKASNTARELMNLGAAKEKVLRQLEDMRKTALERAGEESAQIFEIHQMMVQDLDYCEQIEKKITEEKDNAAYAVQEVSKEFSQMFASMDDEYMKARAADVLDISGKLISALQSGTQSALRFEEPVILAADDLMPSETVQLEAGKVLGFVTTGGSANSHTAILARTMNLPALVQADPALLEQYDGHTAIVDGGTGEIYVDYDEATLFRMTARKNTEEKQRQNLEKYRGRESVTKDGTKVDLFANIGHSGDAKLALENDAEGIGLFRSEFLFLEQEDYPSEELQFASYRKVAEAMGGRKVIIRTLDIGADKKIDYFKLKPEENPALGCRGIRLCFEREDVFRTQLRALYRASAYGKIGIMFPMIISVEEVEELRRITEEIQNELRAEGIPFDEGVELGVMIETPAAALISGELAEKVDFFSIGTNDLTQYTLALDRQNEQLDRFYDPHHLAVLRLIKMTVENAHQHGIWVGVCGELGADTSVTDTLISLGVDELSVSPPFILKVRKAICSMDIHGVTNELMHRI